MLEARAIVESIDKAKASVESKGGKYKGSYSTKDIVLVPKGKDPDLRLGFVRLRIYESNNWSTKRFVLIDKRTEWTKDGKKDIILMKKEFDTEKEADEFLKKYMPSYKKILEYSKEGWQYDIGDIRIFIEDIESLPPTMEIESDDEKEIMEMFKKIGVKKIVHDSVPELVRKALNA